MSTVPAKQIAELKSQFQGAVITPGDPAYDSARQIWNAMIDKRPAIIARCASSKDIATAVDFANASKLVLAVRGGGHNIAGSALCNDGIVVDLSGMKTIHVDAKARRATVEAGATLADMDAATQAHGLATPLGINSTTGVAGLTLGGGFGWLSRRYGMTIDNLLSADITIANGKTLHASATENADLFWAIRGGGGNFGIVNNFEFQLHEVGPNLLSGLIAYPLSDGRKVLHNYRDFIADAPDELAVWVVMRKAPPLPFLPEAAHGTEIVAIALLHAGKPEDGESLIKPLRKFGTPLGEHVGVQPYTAWQQAFDPLLAPGSRNYWKSHNFVELPDALLDAAIAATHTLPTPQCEVFFGAIGGATTVPAPDATAYTYRDTRFVMNVHGRWDDPADDQRVIAWARDYFNTTLPFASGGAYINFLTEDETDRIQAAYGQNYERLSRIKKLYDPDNLFRTNQNIQPA
jgi:FAD/FMN-containing dehydrogenase